MNIEEKKERKVAELVREVGRKAIALADSLEYTSDNIPSKYLERHEELRSIASRCVGIDHMYYKYCVSKYELKAVYETLDNLIFDNEYKKELVIDLFEDVENLAFLIF